LYDAAAEQQMPANAFDGTSIRAYRLPDGESEATCGLNTDTDQLVNVLFTSGSTGKPKGVMLRHRSVSNLYSQMKSLLDPIEGTVLCSTNSVFDCFVVETLIALALGRTVVLTDEEEMMLPWKLAKLMETYHTGITEMTPSRLQMCLGNDAFCAAAKHIRIILLGGEVVTQTLSEKFYQHTDGILMNMYGPTEATVFTTMGPVIPGKHITIGAPLQNTRTYVLDQQLRPVIPTACGELYIAGECLSAGYISQPELTEAAFLEDIYFPGEKMYRSGDLVRLRLDGSFDYIGRKDAQVKLNGQRVELGEITGAILQVSGVNQAAVVPIKKEDGSMELCAFFESTQPDLTQETILAHLRKVLPKYMIPGRILALESIPTTATNKIDIQALLKLAVEGIPEVSATPAPVRAVPEQKVAVEVNTDYILSVWNRILSIPVRDENVSFF
jgi:amino acid adenylation domain-containing protein